MCNIDDKTSHSTKNAALARHHEVLESMYRIFVGSDSVERAMLRVLEIIGQALELDVISLYLVDEGTGDAVFKLGWIGERMSGYQMQIPSFKQEEFAEILAGLSQDALFCTEDTASLVSEGGRRIAGIGIKAIAATRITGFGRLCGFIAFDDFKATRRWSAEELDLITKTAHIIGGMLMRKQAEDSLRKSNETFNLVFDHINAYVYVCALDTKEILFASKGLLDRIHATAEEVIGRHCRDVFCGVESCETCPESKVYDNGKGQVGAIHTWEQMNERLGGWFSKSEAVVRWLDEREALVVTMADVTALKYQQEEIKHLVYFDTLLDIPNRIRCEKDLTTSITNAVMTGRQGAVLLLDLDEFKNINDMLGHSEGDKLLMRIAEYLQSVSAQAGMLYRFGGDEFLIVLPDTTEREAADFCKALGKRFKEPWALKSRALHCECSVGIAMYPKDGASAEDIIRSADIAMYRAKSHNRGGFSFYERDIEESFSRRMEIERCMRRAIDDHMDGFSVFYQPIVDPATGTPRGAEALLRWQDRELGALYPDSFIPIAEHHGLILPLGEWVLLSACKFCVEVQRRGVPDFYISVNLSVCQLQASNIVQVVKRALAQTGLEPGCLHLEVTESIEVINVGDAIAKLKKLRKLGIRIAMDDFGTGYSSLGNLRKLPLDVIKIDKSFIQNVDADLFCKMFIHSITELAHSIDMAVCIEGVETEQQLRRLEAIKADTVQGYYFSRPIPRDRFMQYLSDTFGETLLQ